jgi:hypothetical protein
MPALVVRLKFSAAVSWTAQHDEGGRACSL